MMGEPCKHKALGEPMAQCEVCGNDFDKAFQVVTQDRSAIYCGANGALTAGVTGMRDRVRTRRFRDLRPTSSTPDAVTQRSEPRLDADNNAAQRSP